MPTINNVDLVRDLIHAGGRYETDPVVQRITAYQTGFGGVAYGLDYESEETAYYPSEYVIHPVVIFDLKNDTEAKFTADVKDLLLNIRESNDIHGLAQHILTRAGYLRKMLPHSDMIELIAWYLECLQLRGERWKKSSGK